MLRLCILFVTLLQACLARGGPASGGPPAVTTSILPNPMVSAAASAAANKSIVAAGLSDAALKRLYASIPESQHSTIKVLNANDDDTGYVECYPLWGAPEADCTHLTAWINKRARLTDQYHVDEGYCWDAQLGDCRAFMCAEGIADWVISPALISQVMGSVVSACAPDPYGDTQSGAWHWNTTWMKGDTSTLRCSLGRRGFQGIKQANGKVERGRDMVELGCSS
ncbi:uncharacterized protein PG998_007007 [Apiospora kogelbergensis]|uniref:uncharacterized protein n=1 Tax=Apiospora kogelbergensis TaxID=1337665 RepID=UPI0031300E17